jgi:hypothetical protein
LGFFYENKCDNKSPILVPLIIRIAAVKLIILIIDPSVMFFIDDSSRYIDTAISSYIPPDRSFLYGFLIRWLTYFGQSLTTLIVFQTVCSAASAVMAGYALNRFLSVSRRTSMTFAVLCAIAPIQLLYERYVLTETISLMLFALYVTAAFFFLNEPKIRTIFALNLTGVFLIAFRLSYLPVVLSGAVIVPALSFLYISAKQKNASVHAGRRIAASCLYILVSCLLTYGLHSAYKTINGGLSDKPPAYQYSDGYHLLASWTPLLEKEDFSDPGITGYTKQYFYFYFEDRFQRMNHRWSYYGLIGYIHRMYDSRLKTNKIARDTAMNILRRNPSGVIRLALQSYADYWDMERLKKEILPGDRCTRAYPDQLIEILKTYYHMDGLGLSSKRTLTNQYFLNAIPWYIILFSLPLIVAMAIYIDKGRHLMPLALLGFFSLLILVDSTVLIHRNTMRFFHPNEWMAVIFLGVLFDRIMKNQ